MISRQEKLLNIIKTEKISKQTMLVDRLLEAGYDVTQATVSRDMHSLNIIKYKDDNGQSYYRVKNNSQFPDHFVRVLRDGYVKSELAMNILVIKTVSGLAMAVAAALDAFGFPEIIGCIAGDDTIFVAASDIASAKNLMKKIESLL